MFRGEVRVAHHHRQGVMSEEILHLEQGGASLDGPRGEGVAYVVEPDILNPGRLHCLLPVTSKRVPAPSSEDESLGVAGGRPTRHDGVGLPIQRFLAPPAGAVASASQGHRNEGLKNTTAALACGLAPFLPSSGRIW